MTDPSRADIGGDSSAGTPPARWGPWRVATARSLARRDDDAQSRVLIPLKPADLAISGSSLLCAAIALAGHAHGWEEAVATFLLLAVLPPALRAAGLHWHSQSLWLLADFSPAYVLILAYGNLGPVADFFRVPLADSRLQLLDERIFGLQPAIAIAPHVTGWESGVLMLCYCSYYLWPVLLGGLLYYFRGETFFDRWSLAVMLLLLLNFAIYMAVPAVGPRFALADSFTTPVTGGLGASLFRVFLRSPFYRDCFPSGHSAMSFMVLWHAWRRFRPFFWVALLPCTGIIVATLAMRFHYGVDLLAAVPLTALAYALSGRISSVAPRADCAAGRGAWQGLACGQ